MCLTIQIRHFLNIYHNIGLLGVFTDKKLKKNVVGIVGLVENMPDGKAIKPGDVVKVTVNRIDLETPSQAKLTPKVLSITLKASDENAISRYLYSGQGQ